MKDKDRFQRIRRKKNIFTLNLRLTLVVGLVMIGSTLIAFGVAVLLKWLFPAMTEIPLFMQMNLLGLITTMLAIRFLSRLFFDPIKQLNDAMQRVADGDFSTRLELKSSSVEIQEMIAGFNMMTHELQSTEILQTDFVSNVSHEFKTPINAIEGYATLLQGCDSFQPEQQQYVEKILFNTQRLSSLVSNILLLSKLENQTIQTNQEPYQLDEQIRESIVGLESAWSQKELEWDVDLAPTIHTGNEAMMRHVWNNLLSNAIKFSPNGATITLRLTSQGEHTVFTVADQGPGFSEETEKHLFDKFYQEDASHKEEGNGLGLALVKRILTIENGEISAHNLPNGGCEFRVIL